MPKKLRKPVNFYKNINNIAKELIVAGNWMKFAKEHESAYRSVRRYFSKERLEKITGIKRPPRKPFNYYKNIENIAKELKSAGSWTVFRREHGSAYGAIKSYFSYEALEELTGIYRISKNTPKIWTEEKIRIEAKKFTSRNQFRQKSPGAANAADRLGIFESACEYMPRGQFGWLYGVYAVVSESKKKTYVGLTRYLERREASHLKYKNNSCRSRLVTKHSDAKFIVLTECVLDASDAINAEKDAYSNYVERGYEVVNNKRCLGRLGTGREIHTEKNFKQRVNGFKGTLEGFYKATERSCIQKAREQGWLQYAYDHLPSKNVNFEKAKELAAQCSTVSEFVKRYPRESDFARNRGWMPAITAHMEHPTPLQRKASAKWGTEEKIWAEVYRYTILRDFIRRSNGAYKAIRRFDGLSQKIKNYFANPKLDLSTA
jgi:predicted GIY-YIG superfamily endonuclease